MDTPIITQYYRETEPEKRKELLEQAIASGEEPEANEIRKEIWEARYKGLTNDGSLADGYLKFWMALEFNRNAGHKVFGSGRAQKEIRQELDDVKFREICEKSELHKELLYRECCHMVKTYMELSESDKAYNSTLFGIMKMSSERAKDKLKADIYDTAVVLPQTLKMEEELGIITRAAREMYELHFPGEGSLGADR